MMKIKERQLLVGLLIFSLLYKIVYVLVVFSPSEILVDAKDYFDFAQLILRDGPFVPNQDEIEAFAPPGFPWLVALMQGITGWAGAIVILNAILSTATLWVIYRIAKYVLKGYWALLPVIWAAIYVPYTLYLGNILKEALVIFLVSYSVLLLIKCRREGNWKDLILLSGVFTYTFHTDERYFIFIPIVLLGLCWPLFSKKSVVQTLVFVAGVICFSTPWFIRNYQVYNRPVFITERFQSPIDKRMGIDNRLNERNRRMQYFYKKYRDSLVNGVRIAEPEGRLLGIDRALDEGLNPHDFTLKERLWYNSLGYWSPIRTKGILIQSGWKYKGPRSLKVNLLYTLNYGILLPLMLVGIFYAWRNRNRILIWMIAFLMFHYLLHVMLIFGSGRYRHPVDFVIIILAFYGLNMAYERFWAKARTKNENNIVSTK